MTKEKAQALAKAWNIFRLEMGKAVFMKTELCEMAKLQKLTNAYVIVGRLIEMELLSIVEKRIAKNGLESNLYQFKEEPIHFSVIRDAIIDHRNKIKMNQSLVENESSKDKLQSIGEQSQNSDEKNIEELIKASKADLEDLTELIMPFISNAMYKENPKWLLQGLQDCKFRITACVELDGERSNNILGEHFMQILFSSFHKRGISTLDTSCTLDNISSEELVEILRSRGIQVKAKQTIEM